MGILKDNKLNPISKQLNEMNLFCTSIYFLAFKFTIMIVVFTYSFIEVRKIQQIFYIGLPWTIKIIIFGLILSVLSLLTLIIKKSNKKTKYKGTAWFEILQSLNMSFWCFLLCYKIPLMYKYKIDFSWKCIFTVNIASIIVIFVMQIQKICKSYFHEKGHGKFSIELNEELTHLYIPHKTIIFGYSSIENFKKMLNAGVRREIEINTICFLGMLIAHLFLLVKCFSLIHYFLIDLIIITMYFIEYTILCWAGGFSDFRIIEAMDKSDEINNNDLCIMFTVSKDNEEECSCIQIPKQYKCGQWIKEKEKYKFIGYKVLSGAYKNKIDGLENKKALIDKCKMDKIGKVKYIFQYEGEVKIYDDRSFIKLILK